VGGHRLFEQVQRLLVAGGLGHLGGLEPQVGGFEPAWVGLGGGA
jgi:hypothetical protein